jgi:acetyltransferase-like isoleucine patch superfamily enzyme
MSEFDDANSVSISRDEFAVEKLAALRLLGGLVLCLYTGLVYFLSFVGPAFLVLHFDDVPIPFRVVLAVLGYGLAGTTFLLLLIVTKRVLPDVHVGVTNVQSKNGQIYFIMGTLTGILEHSPFKSWTLGISPFSTLYYRCMGAKMPSSVLIGPKTLIFDPWFFEFGNHVVIGTGAIILGHLGHGKDIILGKVRIGEGAVIGVNAVIFPDVVIGAHARIGAGAVVTRGTVIPDGDIWVGIPARKGARSSP